MLADFQADVRIPLVNDSVKRAERGSARAAEHVLRTCELMPSGPVAEEKLLETSGKGCWKLLQLLRMKRHRIQELFCSCVWQLGCQVALISWSTAVPLYTRTHFAELGRMTG